MSQLLPPHSPPLEAVKPVEQDIVEDEREEDETVIGPAIVLDEQTSSSGPSSSPCARAC